MAFMQNIMSDQDVSVLLEMLETGELCDFKFVANDNSEIKVHAHVFTLSSLSEKFKTEVKSSPESKLAVSNKSLRFLIKFVYEGPSKCELSEDILREIIEMSNCFEIVELQELCSNFIEAHVNEDNCFEFLAMSQLLPLSPSKNKILEFMAVNIKKLKDSELASLEKIQILNLLKHECLNMTQEEAAVLTKMWVDNNNSVVTTSEKQILIEASQQKRIPAEVVLIVGNWNTQSEYYNPLTQSWGLINLKAPLPGCFRKLEVIGSNLFLIGGSVKVDNLYVDSDNLHKFDMTTQIWSEMSSMNQKRCQHSTAVMDGKLYAFGGHNNDNGDDLKSAEVYSPARNQWDNISDMNTGRSNFASVVFNQKIYVIGGNTIEKYDAESDTWTVVGNMAKPRRGASAVALGDRIYIMGGRDGTQILSSVECFTPGLTRCVWHQVPNMNSGRSDFSAIVINNEIVVIGGISMKWGSGILFCSDVEVFNPKEDVWRQGAPLKLPRSFVATVACTNFLKLPS